MNGDDFTLTGLPVDVPMFVRIADYIGIWAAYEPVLAALRTLAEPQALESHLQFFAAATPPPPMPAAEMLAASGGKQIALIRLTGLLMKSRSSAGGTSSIEARRQIRMAAADPNVSGILLAIDSPGGTVSGTDDLAADVKAAKRMKPVYAHIDDLGASAAYWIASQADKVTANSPTALVGSIGTLQVVQDISAAADKAGVRTLVFATGALKGMGTPGTTITDEQAQHIQGLVNSVQEQFDAAVRNGRGLSAKQLADVKHGGVMTATDAKQAGLIDAIQPLGKTLAELTAATKDGAGMDRRRAEVDSGTPSCVGSLPTVQRQTLPTMEKGT